MQNGLFLRILIVVALLCAQAGGLAHGISHLSDAQAHSKDLHDGKSAPGEKHCDLCDAYGQIASAIGSSIAVFMPEPIPSGIEPAPFHSRLSLTSVPFAARAPPYSA